MDANTFAKELKETFEPSMDIANSALALAANRCADLGMPPAICFILLRELADMNARAFIKERQEMVDNIFSALPPELKKQLPGGGELDVFEEINGMIVDAMKHVTRLTEKEITG